MEGLRERRAPEITAERDAVGERERTHGGVRAAARQRCPSFQAQQPRSSGYLDQPPARLRGCTGPRFQSSLHRFTMSPWASLYTCLGTRFLFCQRGECLPCVSVGRNISAAASKSLTQHPVAWGAQETGYSCCGCWWSWARRGWGAMPCGWMAATAMQGSWTVGLWGEVSIEVFGERGG